MELYAMRAIGIWCCCWICLFAVGCREQHTETGATLFKSLDADQTGVSFTNQLTYTESLNTYTFRNFYNGGGVGLGDFNNDGLLDIFFAGNLVSNKLYLNKGNFRFEDITTQAGLESEGTWTTGVSVADVNGDGWLDIYICKSGPPDGPRRRNELLINNGDTTFTDQAAAYGLDFKGLSIHAAFFDYDQDGDLDCYLLNNSIRSVGGYDLRVGQREIPDTLGGNKLLRNDSGRFVDVSREAGIYTSEIGFGLGVTIGDVDQDGWQDIYVSNDFFERDYLYINQRDGRFVESLETFMQEISMGSMGADMADINNDGYPEIFVTEMLPERDDRLKTTAQFENWEKYQLSVSKGYHHQFGRNVLQLNNGDGTFSEIGRFAGVHATDWSWGALIFDMDNDGLKDIFVANGIYKDLIDQDYVNFVANQAAVRQILLTEKKVIKRLIDSIPSNKIPNYAFRNQGDLTFKNVADVWGLAEPSHSNGAAYGDLDNDGDLDLVISNVNMPSALYENLSERLFPDHHQLRFSLQGAGGNTFALGSKIYLYVGDKIMYQELSPMRGFMSSVEATAHFGLGSATMVDSVRIIWPDRRVSKLYNVRAGERVQVNQADSSDPAPQENVRQLADDPVFMPGKAPGLDFVHRENDYNDFDRDRLLFHMISNEGPCACKGDVNNDGREDIYLGGAKGQPGQLFVQTANATFRPMGASVIAADQESEDTSCAFFDANGDGYDDLYVASGGNEFSSNSPALLDRLYLSDRGKTLVKGTQLLPAGKFESTSVVKPADFDGDGDADLFVGIRVLPGRYGFPANGYLLRNDGNGNFENVTRERAPVLERIGMITDAAWADLNQDGQPDLVITGEWMPLEIFINSGETFTRQSAELGLDTARGWYHAVLVDDWNGDGIPDILAGNHGLNSRFRATASEPISMYLQDFDQNGTVEQILTRYYEGKPYPFVMRQDLVTQIPALKKKYLYYRNYRWQTMEDIFDETQLRKALVLQARDLETSLWLSDGGKFRRAPLPQAVQLAPVYALSSGDFDGDGLKDILVGGNLHRAKPEAGIYSASHGLLLKGDGKGDFVAVHPRASGVSVKGEIREWLSIAIGDGPFVLAAMNNQAPVLLRYKRPAEVINTLNKETNR